MTHEQVARNVIHGAISGYFRIAVRMLLGLVTFRLLYEGLTPEAFGFWSLLWSLFGYGVLLDFGFGYAAQKRVAELSVARAWDELSRVLSTILGFYVISAVLSVGTALFCSDLLMDALKVTAGNRESFQSVLQVFLIGVGLAFPLGLFPDVLLGQQRMAAANNLGLLSTLANFACVLAVVRFRLGLLTLAVLALVCVLVPYAIAAWIALLSMPKVQLRPRHFSVRVLAETTRFSFFAYLNLLGNVIRHRADQPVIATFLGVAAITPYQPGSRIAEMFGLLTRQLADVLSPAAAHLHARGDAAALRRFLLEGQRFSILAATPLYVVTAAYLDRFIQLLTGISRPSPDMIWVGELLLLWYYSLVLTHLVFKRMYLMAGQERRMMWQGLLEAGVSLLLGITLMAAFRNIQAVAWGSVLPAVFFGWFLLWSWTAREARLTRLALFRRVIAPAWISCLPMALVAAMFRMQSWWRSGGTIPWLMVECLIVLGVGVVGIWFLGLSNEDRLRLRQPWRS